MQQMQLIQQQQQPPPQMQQVNAPPQAPPPPMPPAFPIMTSANVPQVSSVQHQPHPDSNFTHPVDLSALLASCPTFTTGHGRWWRWCRTPSSAAPARCGNARREGRCRHQLARPAAGHRQAEAQSTPQDGPTCASLDGDGKQRQQHLKRR